MLHSASIQWGKIPPFQFNPRTDDPWCLCKMSFYFDLSIVTGLFPCLVEYHSAGWECFLLIYWYLYLKVHLSATVVNSPLVSQTL